MAGEVAVRDDVQIVADLVLTGDMKRMKPEDKVIYYRRFCESLGLNPLTQPFQYIVLNGKERLYATKDATEQLRKIHGVSVTDVTREPIGDVIVVTAKGVDKTGRSDTATGAVTIGNLKGDALANALMKAETKAKRRLTLSICGLGMLDETEIETIPNAVTVADAVTARLIDGMEKGRAEIEKLIERYEPIVAPMVIQTARIDMAAAKSAEDLRAVYASLKKQGAASEREEAKATKPKITPTKLADDAEPVLPDGDPAEPEFPTDADLAKETQLEIF